MAYPAGTAHLVKIDATNQDPIPVKWTEEEYDWNNSFSTALETHHAVLAAPGHIRACEIRVDSTAPDDDYYILIISATTLPPNGAVTLLDGSVKVSHLSGTDDQVPTLSWTDNGMHCAVGCVIALSTTEFTLTVAGAYMSLSALVRVD